MNQFKQIFSLFPHYASSKSIGTATSGYTGMDGLFRNSSWYRQQGSEKDNKLTKFLHYQHNNENQGKENNKQDKKFAMEAIKKQNLASPDQKIGNSNNSQENKDDEKGLVNDNVKKKTNEPKLISEFRSYTQMISDYCKDIEKKQPKKDKGVTDIRRSALFKLPFYSVISTFSKFDRMKFNEAKCSSSNNLQNLQDDFPKKSNLPIHNILSKEIINELRIFKKNLQPRGYFTKRKRRMLKSDEQSRILMKNIIEARKKHLKIKLYLIMMKDLENSYDFIFGENKLHHRNNNLLSDSENVDDKSNSMSFKGDDKQTLKSISKQIKDLNIFKSKDKIDVEIPISISSENNKNINTKSSKSVVKLEISATLEERPYTNDTHVNKKIRITDKPESSANQLNHRYKKSIQSNKAYFRNSKGLPWWTSSDSTIRDEEKSEEKKSSVVISEQTELDVVLPKKNKEKYNDSIDNTKLKRLSDSFKPIEKREDGVLIDYGVKVTTRKPKQKPSEKLHTIPVIIDNSIPEKTILMSPEYMEQLQHNISEKHYNTSLPMFPTHQKKFNFLVVLTNNNNLPFGRKSKLEWIHNRLTDRLK
ncbi:PREDICTED: uncharacterized protein LOC105367680 [Ceratosolen solmsi marchali]|uniref:Uncharacterized protein LOC105367680 n=1 Tax=Ceratosolen solmsi marchali TaxID=326594 RepID=A0AAJ6YUQ2_9HYME|nr:PREDICTED: uncharacterized protein LOC105367680 [Ceratosolen solmsi marchali]